MTKGDINGMGLCAGIGGLELGISRVIGERYRTVCLVEKDPKCQAALKRRMLSGDLDQAPIWDDLTTFDGAPWRGLAHIIAAGFPCQPFSSASRGRQVAVDLWPHVARVISETEPGMVLLENVPGAPWSQVQSDLRDMGFIGEALHLSAEEIGAPHRRRRVFLPAYSNENSESMGTFNEEAPRLPALAAASPRTVSGGLGVDDGLPSRMDRLRMLGNAVVPQAVERLFL